MAKRHLATENNDDVSPRTFVTESDASSFFLLQIDTTRDEIVVNSV